VCRYQAITHALAGIGARTNRRIDSASFATHQYGHISATDKLATDQAHFSRFGHRVRRFNRRHQATRFNHA
jgi:hypothetical protein